METIGLDRDGTITRFGFPASKWNLPWYLFLFLLPWFLIQKPKKGALEFLKRLDEFGGVIIIICRWPKQLIKINAFLLKLYHVPYDDIICIGWEKGAEQRKLKAAKEAGVEVFIDDEENVVSFFNANGILAFIAEKTF
ncbi:hypothetical protein ACFLYY_02415 [Patescibacteria group bacterium]